MKTIQSNGNKSTEERLIKIFKINNITGWRRNRPLFGKPDFTFPKDKLVVFTDGCFWHGHNCRNITPKQNAPYWANKINRNFNRDKAVTLHLKEKNWKVLRIWECEIKKDPVLIAQKVKHLISY